MKFGSVISYTNPLYIRGGDTLKIFNLLIHLNLYLTDKRTKKRFSVFFTDEPNSIC